MNDAGQGLCLAMEDAVVLAWHLRRQGFTPRALRRSDMCSHRQGLSAQALHKPGTLLLTNHHWLTGVNQQNLACVFLLLIVLASMQTSVVLYRDCVSQHGLCA